MATVFLGSLEGALGFRQLVAIKRPHPHLMEDPGFREALLREARLAAGIHHANVVDVRDVEVVGDAVQLVMDYIEGASLGDLVRTCATEGKPVQPGIAVRIVLDACAGLHAAHELTDDAGRTLGLVHRDVSPQNVLVGVDGVARVTDFGIAKCFETSDPGTSRESLKGKVGYMAPEYVRGETVDRRVDVFALGVVLWEALCGRRLFRGQSDAETLERVLSSQVPPVSEASPELAPLDAPVARALHRDPAMRFPTTEAMAQELQRAAGPHGLVAGAPEVGRFVRETLGPRLDERRRALREARTDPPSPSTPPPAKALELLESTTTVPQRAPRRVSRVRLVLVVAGVVVVAGAGAVALAHSRGAVTPAASVVLPPPAASTAVAGPSSAAPPTSLPSGPAAPAVAPSPRNPGRPPSSKTAHLPPPNPYPTGP
jgi:serine/threonine-protein kinase